MDGKEFKHSLRGYNTTEVDLYIDGLREEIENLREENKKLSQSLKAAKTELELNGKTEEQRKAIIVNANAQADEIICSANEKADEIIGEAKEKATLAIVATSRRCNRIIANASSRMEEQKKIYEAAKEEASAFRRQLLEQYGEHIKLIGEYFDTMGAEGDMKEYSQDIALQIRQANMAAEEKETDIQNNVKTETELDASEETDLENFEDFEEFEDEEEFELLNEVGFASEEINEETEKILDSLKAAVEEKAPIGHIDKEDIDEFDIPENPAEVEKRTESELKRAPFAKENREKTNSYGFTLSENQIALSFDDDEDEFENDGDFEDEEFNTAVNDGTDDSDEFYTAVPGSKTVVSEQMMGVLKVPGEQSAPSKDKKWTLKKSMTITDEFDVVKYEDED